MQTNEFVKFTLFSLIAHRMRSILTATGIAIGIAAVVLLTSIGEGMHQYVMTEFSQFGTNIISVQPGTIQTHGANVAALSNVRPLSIEDSVALQKLSQVQESNGSLQGLAEIEGNNRQRKTIVYGVSESFPRIFEIHPKAGKFLPKDNETHPRAYAVLGSKVKTELFKDKNALGQRIRVGGQRFRVVGVMESKGSILGIDLDDCIYIPTSRALDLFNKNSLMEIQVKHRDNANVDEVVSSIKRLLIARHGQEDFTIIKQEQMLEVLNSVLDVLTFAVGALGGISLFVGGIGVLTIMSIAVNERVSEIGLFRALGAHKNLIMLIFLGEAMVLSGIGGLVGLLIGIGGANTLHFVFPAIPVHTPWSFVFMAEILALMIGLIAGVLPAKKAASLDPIDALRTE